MLMRSLLLASGFTFALSTQAVADHRDEVLEVIRDADFLAVASEELAEAATTHHTGFSSAALRLHFVSEGYSRLVSETGFTARGRDTRDHREETATFEQVENAFLALARQWNENAGDFSADAALLDSYLRVNDEYRALLFNVYDLD